MSEGEEAPRVSLQGSERKPVRGAESKGPVDPDETVTATVVLRRPGHAAQPDPHGEPVSREEFADSQGADPEDIAKVEAFAATHGLEVTDRQPAARLVTLQGPASAMAHAFGVELTNYEHNGARFRGREGHVTLPAHLEGTVEAVIGLDTRPQLRPHFVLAPDTAAPDDAQARPFPGYKPTQVAQLYGFPETDGTGRCIGILEFGGGYQTADLDAYFGSLGFDTPEVVSVGVHGARNRPGDPADVEVALDIDVAGAVAPKAKIAVYFARNDDRGFLSAVAAALHDTVNRPDVISISWGGREKAWTPQTMTALDGLFADARAMGVAVMAAAGDHGSADEPQKIQQPNGTWAVNPSYDGLAHVDFPASSPNVTACGGTRLAASDGIVTGETVWNDNNGWATGGGISDVFPVPAWQQGRSDFKSVNGGRRVGRGVPDVAGNADSATGYKIYVNGRPAVVGGTSAVAPLWSGLAARLLQLPGGPKRIDNEWLYSLGGSAFRDITMGSNAIAANGAGEATAGYDAAPGWDACTGLGSPAALH